MIRNRLKLNEFMKVLKRLLLLFLLGLSITYCDSPNENKSPKVQLKEDSTVSNIEQNNLDCNNLPTKYSSYDEAIQLITTTTFKINESVNTSRSSWIRGANYYSCDGLYGFLIIKTDRNDYIHSNVPISVWEGFKNANSFGSYYDHYIKFQYRFKLN